MFEDEAVQEINKIPLSNNAIQRLIMDLSADIEESLWNKLQNSEFALQVDESTDITNKGQLLTFIPFIDGDQIIIQFFCRKEILSGYHKKWIFSWKSCVGICTDGAPSMVGSTKEFASLVKQENPNVIRTHCFLHREVLVSKTLPVELKDVLDQVVEMVNQTVEDFLFEQICVDMDSQPA